MSNIDIKVGASTKKAETSFQRVTHKIREFSSSAKAELAAAAAAQKEYAKAMDEVTAAQREELELQKLRAQASGDDRQVAAIQREIKLRAETVRLVKALGVAEHEAYRIAQERLELEEQITTEDRHQASAARAASKAEKPPVMPTRSSFSIGNGLAALGIGIGVTELTQFGKESIEAAAKIETLTTSFEVMTGSARTASTLIGDIVGKAASTPLQTDELAESAKKLIAFNVATKDVIPTMMKLGDVSAGIGAPIGEIAEIYGKAKVQGRLFAEDVNQLTGRGIPVIQEFAKQFGVTDDKVKGLVESGQIGFEQLEKAIDSLTGEGGKFHNMMQKQSETTAGKISSMADAWEGVKRATGEALTNKGAIDSVTKAFGGLEAVIGSLGGEGGNWASRLMRDFVRHDASGFSVKEYEAHVAEVKRINEERAKEEERIAAAAAQKKAEEEKEKFEEMSEHNRQQYVKFLEDQKALHEKAVQERNDFERDTYRAFLEQKKADEKGYLDQAALMYQGFLADKEKAQKQQDRKDQIEENRKALEKKEADEFVRGELSGPDARREAKRQEARERRALNKFGRLQRLKSRHGMAEADAQGGDPLGPPDVNKQPGKDDKNSLIPKEFQTAISGIDSSLKAVAKKLDVK